MRDSTTMASTQCFLYHHALTSRASSIQRLVVNTKPNQVFCKAQKQATQEEDDASIVSRRLALTVLIGAAAVGSKVSPADAAYGESGILLSLSHQFIKLCYMSHSPVC